MADTSTTPELDEPAWRTRAVSRSLQTARSRAEERAQRFLDAAFELIDEKGTTDFTIQEVVDRSGHSLRGFYQHFDGKEELLLALLEDSILEAAADITATVDEHTDPLERLRAFAIRLHQWCEPNGGSDTDGPHNRRPVAEFAVQLGGAHPDRVKASLAPINRALIQLVDDASAAGAIDVPDTKQAAAFVERMMFSNWFGNRLIPDPTRRISAQDSWEFCLRGLGA